MVYCTNCGKELPIDSKFCPSCGATTPGTSKINEPISTEPERTEPIRTEPVIIQPVRTERVVQQPVDINRNFTTSKTINEFYKDPGFWGGLILLAGFFLPFFSMNTGSLFDAVRAIFPFSSLSGFDK